MASIPLSLSALDSLKRALRQDLDEFKSSHLSEAIAAALGFKTHAALLAKLPDYAQDPPILLLDDELFDVRVRELGYKPLPDYGFEMVDIPEIIYTLDPYGWNAKYTTKRQIAWRNLMVATINAGIEQKLFSVRPDDNRWPGWRPDRSASTGYIFDFKLQSGILCRGYVWDAGNGELEIHAAAQPKGNRVQFYGAGFTAGDAFAASWLKRQGGAWLQTLHEDFRCRSALVGPLAEMCVKPLGFGDHGRFTM